MGNKIKSKNEKKMKAMGEKFFLEQWEIYENYNIDNDKPEINFDSNLIVSELLIVSNLFSNNSSSIFKLFNNSFASF